MLYEVPCLDLNGNMISKLYQWDIDQKIVIELKGCDTDYLKNAPEVHFCNVKRKEALVVRSLKSGYIVDGGASVMDAPDTSSNSVATLDSGDKIIYSEYIENGGSIGTTYSNPSEWCSFEYKNSKRYIMSEKIKQDTSVIVADIPNTLLKEPYPLLVYVYLTDANDSSSQRTILFSEIPVRKRAVPSDYQYVDNIDKITANNIKNEIEQSTKDAQETAIESIVSKQTSSGKEVDDEHKAYKKEGDNLVEAATTIKNNTNTTYENAANTAKQTQKTIETDMNTLMLKNGLALKTINDGNGNVNVAIIINS